MSEEDGFRTSSLGRQSPRGGDVAIVATQHGKERWRGSFLARPASTKISFFPRKILIVG